MNDSVELLTACNAGCKSGTNNIEMVLEFVKNPELRELLEEVDKRHISIGDRCHKLLNEMGEEEKDPSLIAKMMAFVTTETKMMMRNDETQVAKLMMDGCNMGIQSIGEKLNKCTNATDESKKLAEELMKSEEEFAEKLKKFL